MGNLIWWDFVIESDYGFIYFSREHDNVRLLTNVTNENFSIAEFINYNFKKYSKEIIEVKQGLEEHLLYSNHYVSYLNCTSILWKEINKLEVSVEKLQEKLSLEPEKQTDLMTDFVNDNIKYHSFAKSLLLNCAFTIESYINTLIRITAKQDVRNRPEILSRHLNSSFSEKLKCLDYYSFLIDTKIDLKRLEIQNALKVMKMRNKFVHSDLSSELNLLDTLYFDKDYPVFPSFSQPPIIRQVAQVYQHPSTKQIIFAYETMKKFIEYIQSLFIDTDIAKTINVFLNQNTIGMNKKTNNYSLIYSNEIFQTRFE